MELAIQIKFLVHVFIVTFLVNSSKDLYFNDDVESGRGLQYDRIAPCTYLKVVD